MSELEIQEDVWYPASDKRLFASNYPRGIYTLKMPNGSERKVICPRCGAWGKYCTEWKFNKKQ